LFLSFALEMMEDLIRAVPNLPAKYERRRGKYLEDEIERLFVSAFPSAKVYRGSLWHDPETGKDFENDLLVLLDSYEIVVEANLGVTMSLTDLELVFELFDTACEKIHYLARRFEFERNASYMADETDLLAFYIDNGFNIGEAEYDGTPLFIYGISEQLDPYFM